jgi:hypothetical protein
MPPDSVRVQSLHALMPPLQNCSSVKACMRVDRPLRPSHARCAREPAGSLSQRGAYDHVNASSSILRGLIEKGIACRFYEYRALLKEVQNSYNPNTQTTELNILALLFDSEVIVLDELGAAKPSKPHWRRHGLARNWRSPSVEAAGDESRPVDRPAV